MNPYSRLGTAFLRDHPEAAASVLETFPAEHVAHFLSKKSHETVARLMTHFTPAFAASCISGLETSARVDIFNRLETEFQLILLRHVDDHIRSLLMSGLPSEQRGFLSHRIPYAEGTAGSLMEIPLARVPEVINVRDAIKRVKRIRRGLKFYIYATNEAGQLTGVLTLHELFTSPPSSNISQVMHRRIVSVSPAQSVLSVINSAYWQEYIALPVTDEHNSLLGVIRHKTVQKYQDRDLRSDAIGSSLDLFIGVGESFSRSAENILSSMLSVIAPNRARGPHD